MDALSPISLRPIGLQIAASSIMGRRTRRKLGWRLRTTYITGEIRGDTLLISRLSRFSGGGTRLCRWEDDDEVEEYSSSRRRKEVGGRSRFGWKRVEDDGGGDGEWEISYPRVRNCDALPPCDICRDFHSREKRQYGQSRSVLLSVAKVYRLRKRSSASVADCLFFATSIMRCQFRWCVYVPGMEGSI